MRWLLCFICVLPLTSVARGDTPQPDNAKKLYDETLAQLKTAQDRKAELATENERLAAKVAELQKQVDSLGGQVDDLKHQSATAADQAQLLEAHYTAWRKFVQGNPIVGVEWELYLLRLSPVSAILEIPFLAPDRPLSIQE